jgi:hypothetical protein
MTSRCWPGRRFRWDEEVRQGFAGWQMDELEVVELIQESPKFLQAGVCSLLERVPVSSADRRMQKGRPKSPFACQVDQPRRRRASIRSSSGGWLINSRPGRA